MKKIHLNYISKWYGQILHIYEPVFMQNFYYFDVKTEKDYAKILNNRFGILYELKGIDGNFSVYNREGKDICFIWAKNKQIDAVSHEVLHAVHYVLNNKHLVLSNETDEVYCYLLGFLMREILNKRKSHK